MGCKYRGLAAALWVAQSLALALLCFVLIQTEAFGIPGQCRTSITRDGDEYSFSCTGECTGQDCQCLMGPGPRIGGRVYQMCICQPYQNCQQTYQDCVPCYTTDDEGHVLVDCADMGCPYFNCLGTGQWFPPEEESQWYWCPCY